VFKPYIYYIASIVFAILGLGYFSACLTQPYIGIVLENNKGQLLVAISDPYGGGYRAGIRSGDEILRINGEDASTYPIVQKWSEMEGATTIEYRNQTEQEVKVATFNTQPLLLTALREIPLFILGFIFWFIGFLTWYKRPFLEQARILFWMYWLIGLAIVVAYASSRCIVLARELEYIAFSAVPMLLIHFITVFPVTNKNKYNRFAFKIVSVIYILILVIIALITLGHVGLVSLLKKLSLANFSIGFFCMLLNLGFYIRLPKNQPGRNEAGIFLLGIGVGFLPFVLLTALPMILNNEQLLYTQVSSLFISAIPISSYYVIVNKYLPDSRRLYLALLVNIGAVFFLSLIIFFILILLGFLRCAYLESYLIVFLVSLLLISCFYLIRKVINRLLARSTYFKDEFSIEEKIASLNNNLSSRLTVEQILDEIVKALDIDGVFVILENEKLGSLKKAAGRYKDNSRELEELESFFRRNQRLDLEARMLPDDCPAGIYVPFVSSDATCGVFFGRRFSRIKYEPSELPFFVLLAGQLEYQIIMSLVIGKLTKEIDILNKSSSRSQHRKMELQGVTNRLFHKIERERKRLAEELCSGPLQWSMDLNRWLKYLKTISPEEDNIQKVIAYLQERAEDLNYELNNLVNDLGPPIVTHLGLVPALQWLCQKVMTEELSLINLQIQGLSSQNRFAEDIEITAYRFFEKGIRNSVRHSNSHFQTVSLVLNKNRLELLVSDPGRGFDSSQIENWLLTGSHSGLAELKERIESLNGEFQIISGRKVGTTLKATIPIT